MARTNWQKIQYKRLLALLDHAETLADEPKRKLGARLIQITAAVDALFRPVRGGSNHHHVAAIITDLEGRHLKKV